LLEFSLTLGKSKELLSDIPCISEIRLYISGTYAVYILYSPVREWNQRDAMAAHTISHPEI
jgi:hypothetical protein